MGIGSPCRNLKSSISAIGQCADCFGLNIIGDMNGVIAYGFSDESNSFESTDMTVEQINHIAKKAGFVDKGDLLINLTSMPIVKKGMVNTLRVSSI